MFKTDVSLAEFDPEIAVAMEAERVRQEEHIELIASENHASPFIMEAQGSVLTNKYAEGYPGKRYYGGPKKKSVAIPPPGHPRREAGRGYVWGSQRELCR